jgi:membrane protease YdiL (CAAX protease family)
MTDRDGKLILSWSKGDAALVVAVMGVIGLMGAVAKMPADQVPSPGAIIVGSSLGPLLAAAVCWRRRISGVSWGTMFGINRQLWTSAMLQGLWHGCVMLLPVMAVMVATQMVWQRAGWPLEEQNVLSWFTSDSASVWVRGIIVFSAVIVAPVAEEILYRGVLLSVMVRHIRPWKAVLLSSLFFGLLHGNLMATPALTLAGILFSCGYLQTRSLVTPITMHVVFNAANLLLMAFSKM